MTELHDEQLVCGEKENQELWDCFKRIFFVAIASIKLPSTDTFLSIARIRTRCIAFFFFWAAEERL